MAEETWYELSPDTQAIVASNMVTAVALLRSQRWSEKDARRWVANLYLEYREGLLTNAIFHEGPPI